MAAITYVANECEDEIEAHCANIQPGGGNIAQCLIVNEAQLARPATGPFPTSARNSEESFSSLFLWRSRAA